MYVKLVTMQLKGNMRHKFVMYTSGRKKIKQNDIFPNTYQYVPTFYLLPFPF